MLADDAVCRWPHSNERYVGADRIIAMNRAYPEGWRITVLDVLAVAGGAVSQIRVEQAGLTFHAASLWHMRGDLLGDVVEYWVTEGQEEPPRWRAEFSERPWDA